MAPHYSAQNRSGGEAYLGHPRAPPHLFWIGSLADPLMTLVTQKHTVEQMSRGDIFIRVLKVLFGLSFLTIMKCLGPPSCHISINFTTSNEVGGCLD
ncbi:hypothetical protein TNIN_277491 [Trichonephila inaurata madagascariensis]|uniref:Uncharacterized protein n=1 Tax=Trichonephila inaurata madagascariensis TaxID=2747483 RepID=A0A8X6YIN8_9ARAC|nr:hypothetical protein TNIN_277491 [Trichonephila inaurata madagascariensis]